MDIEECKFVQITGFSKTQHQNLRITIFLNNDLTSRTVS